MNIRELDNEEYDKAILLSLAVFTKCGTTDFTTNGLETFKKFIYNTELMNELTIFGAFDSNELIGIIGTKLNGTHISLFFINPDYHHKGIGRKLFNRAYADQIVEKITVNSSSYAVGFYESLGFSKTAEEQETDGLRYTPMIKMQNQL
jgi:GNAT superfamily N-acetyltransferase